MLWGDLCWASLHFQTHDCPTRVGDVSCLFLQETPARHCGLIRELLANNTRAQCHLQLLPLHKGPHWSGLYLFIPLLKSRHERQSCLCVFIMTCVHNRNLEEDSPRESKYGWAFDAGYNWSQMPGSAVTVSSLIQLAFRHDVAWPQPRHSTTRALLLLFCH